MILFRRKASSRDLAEMNRMLASAVDHGVPLERAVGIIASQVGGRSLRGALRQVARSMEEGESLSDALRRFPRVFPEEYSALVEAGIEGGRLAEVLRNAEQYHALRARLARGLGRILAYVGTCFLACMVVLVILTVVAGWAARMQHELIEPYEMWFRVRIPLTTRGLLWLQESAASVLFAGAIGLVLLSALWALFRRLASRTRLGYWIPAWGRIQRSRDMGLFCSAMALRLGGGASVPDSLDRAAEAIPNRFARKRVRDVRKMVGEGDTLSTALFYPRYFPRTLSWGVSMGETRGEVSGVFQMFAELYASDLERGFELLFFVMTPIGLLLVGNIVILMAIAVFWPWSWLWWI